MNLFRRIRDELRVGQSALVDALKDKAKGGAWMGRKPHHPMPRGQDHRGPVTLADFGMRKPRGLDEDEVEFIAEVGLRSKWEDIEYYGPGAAAAEARRRERLGLAPLEEPKAEPVPTPESQVIPAGDEPKKKGREQRGRFFDRLRRRRLAKVDGKSVDLDEEIKRLQDEIAKLEGGK